MVVIEAGDDVAGDVSSASAPATVAVRPTAASELWTASVSQAASKSKLSPFDSAASRVITSVKPSSSRIIASTLASTIGSLDRAKT
jgi:hypothetical protein